MNGKRLRRKDTFAPSFFLRLCVNHSGQPGFDKLSLSGDT